VVSILALIIFQQIPELLIYLLKHSYLPWHLEVVHTDKGYEMLLTIFRDGERASNDMRLA